MDKLTKIDAGLLYGLKQFEMPAEEAAIISVFLEEDDQVLMIDFLASHPEATRKEILDEFDRLLIQRKRLKNSSEN